MNTATMLLLLMQVALPPPVSSRTSALYRAQAVAGQFRAQARP